MKLIPIKYHNKKYPNSINPIICEIAGNFDSKRLYINSPYSLHTEYSYSKRNFNSELIDGLDELKNSHINNIPTLWKNEAWSYEFAEFIKRLIGNSIPPDIIEIHPPFKDYCSSFEEFWGRYIVFYKEIVKLYPNVKIVLENRFGTMYSKSPFLLSSCDDIIEFCQYLCQKNNELSLVIDYPQLFSAEKSNLDCIDLHKILQFNENLKMYVSSISSIHLWGKKKSSKSGRWCAHAGNLNTFFNNDLEKKDRFLKSLVQTFDDELERYFVPEVNSSEEHLKDIVNDLLNMDIKFIITEPTQHF